MIVSFCVCWTHWFYFEHCLYNISCKVKQFKKTFLGASFMLLLWRKKIWFWLASCAVGIHDGENILLLAYTSSTIQMDIARVFLFQIVFKESFSSLIGALSANTCIHVLWNGCVGDCHGLLGVSYIPTSSGCCPWPWSRHDIITWLLFCFLAQHLSS